MSLSSPASADVTSAVSPGTEPSDVKAVDPAASSAVESTDGATGALSGDSFTMDELDRRMKQLLEVQKQLAQRDPKEELSTAILLDRAHKVQQLLEKHPELAEQYTPNVLLTTSLSGTCKTVALYLDRFAYTATLRQAEPIETRAAVGRGRQHSG